MIPEISERALVLAPLGRDAAVASAMLGEAGIRAIACATLADLVPELEAGAGFAVVTEEALATADLRPLSQWIESQPEWSDIPFVLLTSRGGGLERNPGAGRYLDVLGNVTFLERPFHPTTLVSVARSALRGRRRQYEARSRLMALREREAALEESEMRFRAITDSIDQMIWSTQPDGFHDYFNQRWYDYTGVPPGSTDGEAWNGMFHPDDQERAWHTWRRSLETGEPYHIEYRLRHRSGEYRWTLGRAHPVRDASGRIVRWYGTCTEIDAEVRARETLARSREMLQTEVEEAVRAREEALARLHEAQKLETIGQLTGGVAHDFNNLLTPIMGSLDLLRRRLGDDERALRLIDGGMQAAGRAATLVQRLLAFARRQDLQPRSVDIARLLDGMRDLIARSIGPTIEVSIETEADLPPARIDPNQFELAVLNLAVNGRDAMPSGGKLRIVADTAEVEEGEALAPGRYVRVAVVDTGVGMDAETLARAVEPFYSTKGVGKGTGLGLSMVHGLAAQSGGTLELTSRPGKGTRAEMWLPIGSRAPSAEAEPAREATPAARPSTILLVDDEDLVRLGTADLLRDLGYRVLLASSGPDALRMLRERDVDLIISDFLMPGMNGVELVYEARRVAPGLPALLVTGYSDIAEGPGLELPRLTKPFRQTDLARRVAELLRSERGATVVDIKSKAERRESEG
ncbi:MAG TPA: PAS domain-containing protein [Allosphingosinicella sp.]|nr:PAS domain-containing protein [Allosphingosinicella sp.]